MIKMILRSLMLNLKTRSSFRRSTFMKANGKIMKEMEGASNNGKMDQFMKDIGKTT